MEISRINNDYNGNPRYVVHFLAFITAEENRTMDISDKYNYALKKAKKYGGGKFHNKQFGGGIVFSCYDRREIMEIVYSCNGNEIFKQYNVEQKEIKIKNKKIVYVFNDRDMSDIFLKYNKNFEIFEYVNGDIYIIKSKNVKRVKPC